MYFDLARQYMHHNSSTKQDGYTTHREGSDMARVQTQTRAHESSQSSTKMTGLFLAKVTLYLSVNRENKVNMREHMSDTEEGKQYRVDSIYAITKRHNVR